MQGFGVNESKFQIASLLPPYAHVCRPVLPAAGKLLLTFVVWRIPNGLRNPVSSLSLSFPMCAVKGLHFKLVLQVLSGLSQAEAPGNPCHYLLHILEFPPHARKEVLC